MTFEQPQSQPAQQPAGPDTPGVKPETPTVTEAELAAHDDGLDPEDVYGSLDDADKAIWDASARPVKN